MGFLDKIKRHPYITAAIVFAIGLIYLVTRSGGGAQTTGATGLTPDELAAEVQLAQLNAQQTAAGQQVQAQLQALTVQGQTQVAIANIAANQATQQGVVQQNIAQIQANVDTTGQADQLAALLAQYQATTVGEAIAAETAVQQATINAGTTIATVTQAAQQNEYIANQLAQTQIAISGNQSQVAIAGYNAQVAEVKALTQAQTASAGIGAFGGIAGSLIKAIF